ncbi:MAG: ribonucleoside-diphosphate reductase, adenosylcobalamin-dependent [Ignavibacteria bacterium GWF2_33_9]|nr:MAG: ribonucleoside-diphosphate reductase, adenosylcobalamin-dependent [Ignavibacteria bacterium GWF2_33_9]
MKIEKRFTKSIGSPYDMFTFTKRKSSMKNPDGSVVFEANDIEVPKNWSQVATDILAQKYFRKTGVPQFDSNGNPILDADGSIKLGSETSLKQVAHRLAFTWKWWGEQYGYFETPEDAQNFYDEIVYMILDQMAAPNSPQWFNTGLSTVYGIKGSHQGHFYVDPDSKDLKRSEDAYSRPQPHACFINSVHDDLLNKGGIFDLVTREARVFKFGSGSGTNFSAVRAEGERLSGGGISSGLMSFLKIFDRAAGAIKSGGTTRRAAKMVILDVDHPDIETFIDWKAKEESKVAALVAGSRIINKFMKAIVEEAINHGVDPKKNKKLSKLIQKALNRGVPLGYIKRYLDLVAQGHTNLEFPSYDTHYEGEAYNTVSGQNSNNSVRVSNDFMRAVDDDQPWDLKWRTHDEVARTVPARRIWNKINMSAWQSADPGLQFDTTINEWHTCPKSGRINASNPCSEYMFLDDTACNLASLNLMKFFDSETYTFNIDNYLHAIRIWTVILEISVLMAHYPSEDMAQKSYDFRTLGLGYANLGTLLMVNGIPYDSPEGLAWAGTITAMLTGEAYATSAEMAKDVGAFEYYDLNKEDMLRVIRNHRRAAYNAAPSEYEGLTIRPMGIDSKLVPEELLDSAREVWDRALNLGEKHGFRNAQVSVLAPTGTIGLIMDCDTTGIEPDFAMVKFKKLAGGGYFKIVNQSVRKALKKFHYNEQQINEIENYAKGHGTLTGCPHINGNSLAARGFTEEKLNLIENQLPNVFDIRFAFNKFTLGEDFLKSLNIPVNTNNILKELGFTEKQINEANDYICGTMMIEGAPHLKEEHLPIFDTASKCGKNGKRYIDYMAHVKIMAAAQPFISGAISKTVNMPTEATVAEIGHVYNQAWKQMLKAIAIYRDSSKLSQPLNTKIDQDLIEEVTLSDDKFDDEAHPSEIVTTKPEFRKPVRQKLPPKRHGNVREVVINTHKVYVRTGEYSDGTLGEIFIDMYKEGAAFRGLLNSFAILVSKALQYGIPLDELVDTFTFTRFEPAGIVQGHDRIKNSTSVLDFIFRSLAIDYLQREDLAHVPASGEEKDDHAEQMELPFAQNDSLNNALSELNKDESKGQILTSGEKSADSAHLIENAESSQSKSNTSVMQPEFNYSEAVSLGFTGEQCDNCGSMRVKKNGTCSVCLDCGNTTGCS